MVRRLIAARGSSQRRACGLVSVDPETVRRVVTPDAPELRHRLRELAGERRRFGYRRLGVLLEREGGRLNPELHRLDREEGPAVRRRRGRERATGTREPMPVPQAPDDRWSLDVVSDCRDHGRRFRILVIVADVSRECLAAVADTSIAGARLARGLDVLIARRGPPRLIVSATGPAMTCRAVLRRAHRRGVASYSIAPGKPQQNAFAESFIGRMRDGFPNEPGFDGLGHARRPRAARRRD